MPIVRRVLLAFVLSLIALSVIEAQVGAPGMQGPSGSTGAIAPASPLPVVKPAAKSKAAAVTKKTDMSSMPTSTSAYLQDVCSLSTNQCVRANPGKGVGQGAGSGNIGSNVLLNAALTDPACSSLISVSSPNLSPLPSSAIVKTQLGTLQKPFTAQVSGPFVYVYSTDAKLKPAEWTLLISLEKQIGALAQAPGFTIERRLPHSAALGNFTSALKADLPSGLTIAQSGVDSFLLTSDGTTSCQSIRAFLVDVDRFANHPKSDTPIASIFSLDPASVGNVMGATAIPYAASGTVALSPAAAAPAAASGAGTVATSQSASTGTQGTGNAASTPSISPAVSQVASSGTPTGGSNGSTASSSPTITIATTMPVASAGATGSQTPASPTAPGSQAPSTPTLTTTISTTAPTSAPAAAPATLPISPVPAFSVNGRDLYFAEATPGDDAAITEKKRAIALLDLPQPQVLINAWVIQSSTSKPSEAGKVTNLLQETVNDFNDIIQKSLYQGWMELRAQTLHAGYFDSVFHDYITLRTVFQRTPDGDTTKDEKAVNTDLIEQRSEKGYCPLNQYCLGYSNILDPVQPRLTDMLIALLAAQDPARQASCAINAMEAGNPNRCDCLLDTNLKKETGGCTHDQPIAPPPQMTSRPIGGALAKIWDELALSDPHSWHQKNCETRDKKMLMNDARHLSLECFRDVMQTMEASCLCNKEVSPLGLVRAALADFLFNYKRSQQYPHEFAPYDLTASAQELDAQLAQFIHAFNEDLQAYQTFVRARLIVEAQESKVSGDKNTFLNDGIITVQTTSGDVATVNTGTTSYMNVSRAPSINQLLTSITGSAPATSSNGAMTGLLSNLSFNQAQVLMGALAAYQTTSLNVNRQLNLVVKPRSLLGASAAEIDVQLNADQGPTAASYWTPGPNGSSQGTADLSQVTQHDITTHVRIDSIRLFEISSLTAVLSKGRDKFPLLPPFVEIPYIGTLLGIPLHAAKEYHSSSAVLSAVIVPTATDIAYSLRFFQDRLICGKDESEAPCVHSASKDSQSPYSVIKVQSFSDFGHHSVLEYHRMKLHCIATLNGSSAVSLNIGVDNTTSHVDRTIPADKAANPAVKIPNAQSQPCADITLRDALMDDAS